MKLRSLAIIAAVFAFTMNAYSETVHQTQKGEAGCLDGGKSAVEGKVIETKELAGAESGKVARTLGSLSQWGFVSYWFGIPTPAGKATLRFRIYVDGESSSHSIYLYGENGQADLAPLNIPADAKQKSFVNIDIPVDSAKEWSGIAVKKTEKSDKPGPWIDSIKVILP